MDNAENTIFANRYFTFNLIFTDPDDNKFVDCAIASNADFIVTNDKHFDVLKELPYPHLNVISINEFIDILENL
ncbi:MAG: putative toxin-antitoxin system toxin component, PIN family [Spirosomataceae bacterium]